MIDKTIRQAVLVLAPAALLLWGTPVTAQQTAQSPANCLRPMAEPVTVVSVEGQLVVPTPSRDGCWVFLYANRQAPGSSGVVVLRRDGETFKEVRTVVTPVSLPRAGLALTADETILVASSGDTVTLLDVAKVTSGNADPVLGQIKGLPGSSRVATTPDGRHAFVVLFGASRMAVIDLERARKGGFSSDVLVPTYVPTGQNPIHPVVSPDGHFVYATSLFAPDILNPERKCFSGQQPQSAVQVVDVERSTVDPATATVAWSFPAGCGGNAIAVSPDGRRLSNTAADSIFASEALPSELIVYDTSNVGAGRPPVRVGRIGVSKGPVAVVDTGDRIYVGFQPSGGTQPDVLVIDPSKAASGDAAVLGSLPFPGGNLGLSSDGRTLFATSPTRGGIGVIDLQRLSLRPVGR